MRDHARSYSSHSCRRRGAETTRAGIEGAVTIEVERDRPAWESRLAAVAEPVAVLIVEFARQRREREGQDILLAAREAGRLRFRAVCMTAVSFILGIMPLVFATGAGAFGQRSLGITVLGGMLAALLVGTFFIPGFYAIVQSTREKLKRKLGMTNSVGGAS